MVEIRRINGSEVREALDLATEVFLEFEAPTINRRGLRSSGSLLKMMNSF